MHYRTFTGKNKQEIFAKLKEEEKFDPALKDARIIKDNVRTVSSMLGLKQDQIHEIVFAIPDHSISQKKVSVPIFTKKEFTNKKDQHLSHIEKEIIKKKSSMSTQAQDTLFAINSMTKIAEQISQFENELPKATVPQTQKKSISKKPTSIKETELHKELSNMRNEVKELRVLIQSQKQNFSNTQLVDSIQEDRELPNEYEIQKQHIRWIEKYLTEREFSLSLIEDIIEHLNNIPEILTDKKRILSEVESFLCEHIPQTNISLDNYQYGKEIIFVGATGVGKTSTLVKLAAHLSLMRKKSFRFISIDRYKVGGETQLEKLAGYMNTQFHSINKQEEFYSLLADNYHHFTFIDTAGKGPKDTIAIQELSHWITMIGHAIDIHLVVSATTKVTDLEYICESYQLINYNHILVTKLDETKTYGSIISLSYKYQKPFSFVTDGQEIPQDFEIADTRQLIKEALK